MFDSKNIKLTVGKIRLITKIILLLFDRYIRFDIFILTNL